VRATHAPPQGPGSRGLAVTSTRWITLSQQSRPAARAASDVGQGRGAGAQRPPRCTGSAPGCCQARRPAPGRSRRRGFSGEPGGLTVGSPDDGEEHHGGHQEVEERQPPAEEQQVEHVAARHRGACGEGRAPLGHPLLHQPFSPQKTRSGLPPGVNTACPWAWLGGGGTGMTPLPGTAGLLGPTYRAGCGERRCRGGGGNPRAGHPGRPGRC
uniref:Uncharacterized protein n=1 Tax=Apteryx owenii TaxID=8824 RepID=A0A8B9QDL2_APTOW